MLDQIKLTGKIDWAMVEGLKGTVTQDNKCKKMRTAGCPSVCRERLPGYA
jgi:hypothetical protein